MAEPTEIYRTVTPYLVVADADVEMRFLTAAFGAREVSCHRHPDKTVMHAEMYIGDSLIMLGQAGKASRAMPAALYLWVPDVDDSYAKALAAGAASESIPEDKAYGHRNAGVVDANGITWWIGSPVKGTGSQTAAQT
ncbi:MAG: VOC family protein [Acidobacteriota bacterium]